MSYKVKYVTVNTVQYSYSHKKLRSLFKIMLNGLYPKRKMKNVSCTYQQKETH